MAPKKRRASDEYDSDDGFVEKKAKTKHSASKADAIAGGGSRNESGEEYWEISGMRRLAISEFKGKRMISIREYYEKDGQTLPGKKGITMPLEQFSTLITLLPHVEAILREKGEKLPRPEYDAGPVKEENEEEEDPASDKKEVKRKNFEETSDEDE